ncbi:MAG: glycosyltransferase family 2 protein, partial [Bacteroidota bacterium]
MQEISVSVIIPNYNGQEYIALCLKSLDDMDFPKEELEIIVVDNASADDSVALIRENFPHVRLICNGTNLGFAGAINQAAAVARGRYIALLNSDMRVDSNWLTALLDAIQGESGVACAGSMVLNWDGTEVQFLGRREDLFALLASSYASPEEEQKLGARYSTFASGGALLNSTQLYRELGGFDDSYFMYHEDVDLGWRLWLRGYKVLLTPRSVVFHKGGASSEKLATVMIQSVLARNILTTAYRNLDDQNVGAVLPLLLYLLLEQGRAWPPRVESAPIAIQDFRSSLDRLAQERRRIQEARIVSDTEIFGAVGHPLMGVIANPPYPLVLAEITKHCPPEPFDPCDPRAMDKAVSRWLNAAHFVYERMLLVDLWQAERTAHEVEGIKRGRAWRTSQALKRTRAVILPKGSRRTAVVRKAVEVLLGVRASTTTVQRSLAEEVRDSAAARKLLGMLRERRIKRLAARTRVAFQQPAPASATVSIIIPVHDQVEYTLNCLLSIKASRPQAEYEVILLDDASADETCQILEDIPGIRYTRNEKNLGFLRTCNRAAQEARGAYLLFLNNDTRVQPGWMDSLLETFSTVPGAGDVIHLAQVVVPVVLRILTS